MNEETLFKVFDQAKIPFVLIGGTALTVYGSKRVTVDTDIAVRTLDLDTIIDLAYKLGMKLVIGVDKDQYPRLANDTAYAKGFAERIDWGVLKFLAQDFELDTVYDLPMPFLRLYQDAEVKQVFGRGLRVASVSHLMLMKEKAIAERGDPDKCKLDQLDLAFLMKLSKG